MCSNATETLRLFLALWPDSKVQAKIAAIARKVAGRRAIKTANLHLTLVFLGATETGRRLCYEQALRGLTVPPVQLELNRLGCWPKPGILWLGPQRTPDNLIRLVDELKQRLSDCGFRAHRRPFRAHVTLARKFNEIPPDLHQVGEPFSWYSNQIVLVKSVAQPDGSRYDVLQYWP
jgi:2'-5' RNA ligase